ncbi:MAG TPA: M1 family metallopeptidase [Vicinamibacteria bacterium]|nr:M1 family metallopeptidase [Vicinamibacteria bacterium]
MDEPRRVQCGSRCRSLEGGSRAGGAVLLAAGLAAATASADSYPRQPLDVLHYDVSVAFGLDLAYEARARVDVRLLAEGLAELRLDLDGPAVDRVSAHGEALAFRAEGGRLLVDLARARRRGEIVPVVVEYRGRPDGKGLRAGENAHGHPTLFADNWPENARRWIPSIDHPSDKATVDFTVTAEDRYEVVAPGRLVETRSLHDGRRTTRWSEAVPIPTYCMVVGLAEFQVTHMGAADGVPISAWVYPEDAPLAARKLARSALILERLSDLVAPFPFEKLAHVQSSTAWGATEYASAVFYSEKHFRGENGSDGVVAHELAHQWWGDSVTPADWDDLWLSEGFATYFHGLSLEGLGGAPALREHMARAAQTVREANAKKPGAVVDPAVVEPAAKLSAFTYQKGAWVLHMLRRHVGDEPFFEALRRYYQAHAGGTATTDDLRHALEAVSGQDLLPFFRQWLSRPGLPALSVAWRWDAAARQVVLDVAQSQAGELYEIDLELAFRVGDGIERRTVPVRRARETLRPSLPGAPRTVEVDPDGWLLLAAPVVPRPLSP